MPGREKGGLREELLSQLSTCIARGLDVTAADREEVESEMEAVRKVAATVDAAGDGTDERLTEFEKLYEKHVAEKTDFSQQLAARMASWKPGLFIGDGTDERRIDAQSGAPWLPEDNYGIERAFRIPKGHARHVHGRAHAGVLLVQRGATLLPTLDAHASHSGPFSPGDLQPYLEASEPAEQTQALYRARIMRTARSEKRRPLLLTSLQERYAASG